MAGLIKALLGSAYSYDELLKESASFTSNPKLPNGLTELMTSFDGRKRTFVEYTQLTFKEFLKQIATKRSRADQKAELLALCFQELQWIALERAVKDAKFNELWDYFVKDVPWFEPYPKSEWRRLLICRFLISLRTSSWLQVLGRMLYQLEDYIEPALKLYVDYDTEIKAMGVGMFELMLEKVSNYEDDQGYYIGKFKDDVVNPLMDEQYAILDRLGADIKSNKLDVDFYQTQFARIEEIKKHIARTLEAIAAPN